MSLHGVRSTVSVGLGRPTTWMHPPHLKLKFLIHKLGGGILSALRNSKGF